MKDGLARSSMALDYVPSDNRMISTLLPMIRPLIPSDIHGIRRIAALASAEGFAFLDRFVSELESEAVALNSAGEFFLGFIAGGEIVALGGVTPDPYLNDPTTGRLRHVYVRSDHRRSSVGRQLVRELERRAVYVYSTLRLRTDTDAAAQFYQAMGYDPVIDATATHVRSIASSDCTSPERGMTNNSMS
jgi:ribosomal protein S18 acetylase RimI-like enzyme